MRKPEDDAFRFVIENEAGEVVGDQELRYQKATVSVYSFNEPSARLQQTLGFQREGRTRRTVFTNGSHFDTLIFGITAEEFAAVDG